MIKIYGKFKFMGMSIFPFMLIDSAYRGRVDLIRHESIHQIQQVEISILAVTAMILLGFGWLSLLGLMLFYVLYLSESILRSMLNGEKLSPFNKSYRLISFEKEAYENEDVLKYIKERIPFNWIKYLWQ